MIRTTTRVEVEILNHQTHRNHKRNATPSQVSPNAPFHRDCRGTPFKEKPAQASRLSELQMNAASNLERQITRNRTLLTAAKTSTKPKRLAWLEPPNNSETPTTDIAPQGEVGPEHSPPQITTNHHSGEITPKPPAFTKSVGETPPTRATSKSQAPHHNPLKNGGEPICDEIGLIAPAY